MAGVAALCVGGAAATWWLLRDDSAPYALSSAPTVEVTVRPVKSSYPDARRVAREASLLIKVYVQRLGSGDPADLSRIGAPWYADRELAARKLISKYGRSAGTPVEAIVSDPVVPDLAAVDLRFGDGQRQRVDLTRDDGVWWLALGEGDPMKS